MDIVAQSGHALAEAYFRELIVPLLAQQWPQLRYAAARLGSGSDVLGLDDETSRDHDWGLRMTLLVNPENIGPVDEYLERSLPTTFHGYPTRFATTWQALSRHQIEVASADSFATSLLGIEPSRLLSPETWLSLTGQSILELTAGPVYTDTIGRLTEIRAGLNWYPHDVWLYVVAADWSRLRRELPFVGRAGQRGDDLGSRVIAARLVHIAMHLGFMLERRWAPYGKWFGTAFARLPTAGAATTALTGALAADDCRTRERMLCAALELLARLQRSLGLPTPAVVTEPFYRRPFRGLAAVAELLIATVDDADVRRLPNGIGSIEQWSDNVDVLTSTELRSAFSRALATRTARCPQDQ